MTDIVRIPKEITQKVECPTCHEKTDIYVVRNTGPHLHCTRCNNLYHEHIPQKDYAKIRTNWGRNKGMNLIESQAPLCSCHGMFLFNAHPSCPRCWQNLPLITSNPQSKERLLHSDMYIFNGTIEYLENGSSRKYIFE